MKNHLRMDPTQTALIRRQFVADMQRRFASFRAAVWKYLASSNELGLTANAFTFETKVAKLKRFQRWLDRQIKLKILEANPATGEPSGTKPWTYKYIDSAYKKGLLKAYFAMHKKQLGQKQAFYDGTREQFLQSAFGGGERLSKMQLLYTRSYEDLKGVTAAMAAKMSRALADGMANGLGPIKIARNMTKAIDGLTVTRARVIARTETIHAHAEGALDGLEELGATYVTAQVEFLDSGDDAVCPKCKALNGKVFTIKQARGIIPVHPNCRCSWIPYIKIPKI